MINKTPSWKNCEECYGIGQKRRKVRKADRLRYKIACEKFKLSNNTGKEPIKPLGQPYSCSVCNGSGIVRTEQFPIPNNKYPHISIIGGGIGGTALAVACLHRGIPFTLFERDDNFNTRSQGYGLTLQQASKAIKGLGIEKLKNGVVSTRHVVHKINGEIIGEWGMRKWLSSNTNKKPKRTNIHISRQSLRLALLEQLDASKHIKWGHKFVNYEQKGKDLIVSFETNGTQKSISTNLIVGADGIRSTLRHQIIGENKTPLQYLGCIVILGICSLEKLKSLNSSLLDSETVFQTANGNERIYVMPFDAESVMWQLSFPLLETEAKELSKKGTEALTNEALLRTKWHEPIPQIIKETPIKNISGYPVYDRALLNPKLLKINKAITLIGDAAHPMSPFKGQGANQALLDALSLAKTITKTCKTSWKDIDLREDILNEFESEMINRSATKVKASADAVKFLHSEIVLAKGNKTRGQIFKDKE